MAHDKKKHSKKLTITIDKAKVSNPRGGPELYRFKPGQTGNPAGRPPNAVRIRALIERMSTAHPPRDLCLELGIDPSVTLAEALFIVLTRLGMGGDVAAAREVLAALGAVQGSGSRANVLVNVEQGEQRGLTYEFLRHAHGLDDEQLQEVWRYMDGLPRQKPVIDASYFPSDEYRDAGMPDVASADSPALFAHGLLEDPLAEPEPSCISDPETDALLFDSVKEGQR